MEQLRVLGINLSVEEDMPTGVAELEDNKIRTFTFYKDKDIKEVIERFKPAFVVIGAPMIISDTPWSTAKKEMQQLGYPLLAVDYQIKKLAKRASHIKYEFEDKAKFVETHVDSVKKVLGISSASELQNVKIMNLMKNEHEKNAVICAAVGLFYSENSYSEFGDEESGKIILPKLS